MMDQMWPLLFLLLLPKPEPNFIEICDPARVDLCAVNLTILNPAFTSPPTNLNELGQTCKTMLQARKCVHQYASLCLDSLSRQITEMLTYNIAKANRKYCTVGKLRQDFLLIGRCLKRNEKKFTAIWHRLHGGYHAIRGHPKRIAMACCLYHRHVRETLQVASEPDVCPETAHLFKRLYGRYTGDALELACGEYYTQHIFKCPAIISKIPQFKDPIEYQSFLIPMTEVLTKD